MFRAVGIVLSLALCALSVSVASADDHINVFLVPHSHDDTGWQRTVDEYHWEEVRHTYTSVVKALQENTDRRFIFVEMAFMKRWWDEQDADTKSVVKALIKSGQLEIVNGGWCMADEANPDLRGFIDQVTVGHQWASKELGATVKVGWHIDPFGLTAAIPALFSSFGYDMFVGNRISFDLKSAWKTSKHLEFNWAPPSAVVSGKDEDPSPPSLLTHILDSHYSAVKGFDWEYFDGMGGDDLQDSTSNPAVVSKAASAFDVINVKDRADAYVEEVRLRREWYSHNNLLVPFGDDFKWQNAPIQYGNMDKVIAYINSHPEYGVTIKYSTVSEYVAAVKAADVSFPTYAGDFMPYESYFAAYWTGYYVSRPLLKGMIRNAEGYVHSAEVACAVGFSAENCSQADLDVSRQAVAVSHHHDAITGTSLPPVVLDFQTRSSGAAALSADRLHTVVSGALSGTPSSSSVSSASSAASLLTAGSPVTTTVWNSLGWARTEAVTLEPVSVSAVNVTDSAGNPVPSQVDDISGGKGTYRVVFQATVPPMGFDTFTVTPVSTSSTSTTTVAAGLPSLANDFLKLSFDATTGYTSTIQDLTTGDAAVAFSTKFQTYAESGNSNPYVFSPFLGPKPVGEKATTVSTIQGAVMSEINQTIAIGLDMSWRVYHGTGAPFAEAIFTVTPTAQDTAYIVRVNSSVDNTDPSLESAPVFFTDTNGLQMQRRVKGYMPWTLQDPKLLSNITDGIASNFYPSPTAVAIYDAGTDTQLTVLGDRAHSASSAEKGDIQVMVHRRCAESQHIPLDDTTEIATRTWFTVGNATTAAELHRSLVIRHGNPVIPLWQGAAAAATTLPPALRGMAPLTVAGAAAGKTTFSALAAPLPANVNLMTLNPLDVTSSSTQAILRLHHMFAVGEHPTLSATAKVDLSTLFAASVLKVTAITETNLSGVTPLTSSPVSMQSPEVTLQPLSLRTFLVTLAPAA